MRILARLTALALAALANNLDIAVLLRSRNRTPAYHSMGSIRNWTWIRHIPHRMIAAQYV